MKVELASGSTWPGRFELVSPARRVAQAGAICLRRRNGLDEPEVLLIASRGSRGWGIPKGHIEHGETSRQTAQREAFEEGGVIGNTMEQIAGPSDTRSATITGKHRSELLHIGQLLLAASATRIFACIP
ncbi:NUDIX domain-containing protein [Rhizobium tropici]|uniref:NUDIX domain-containing protein n=1 Tax=Rhizobium tropici TaxID=398 RepID=A0A5B0VPL3_RHITR|nr:NUDIX domain-containing protein [Rhizobium tropici]KAA1176526.1 NUDIX domain-containing protein [Rhizobium tropici]